MSSSSNGTDLGAKNATSIFKLGYKLCDNFSTVFQLWANQHMTRGWYGYEGICCSLFLSLWLSNACPPHFSFTPYLLTCLHLQGDVKRLGRQQFAGGGWQEGKREAAQRRNLLATYPTRVLHATNHRQIRPITALRLFSTNEMAPPGPGCAERHLSTYPWLRTRLHCTTLGSCKHHMSFIKLYSGRFLAGWYYKFFQARLQRGSPHPTTDSYQSLWNALGAYHKKCPRQVLNPLHFHLVSSMFTNLKIYRILSHLSPTKESQLPKGECTTHTMGRRMQIDGKLTLVSHNLDLRLKHTANVCLEE